MCLAFLNLVFKLGQERGIRSQGQVKGQVRQGKNEVKNCGVWAIPRYPITGDHSKQDLWYTQNLYIYLVLPTIFGPIYSVSAGFPRGGAYDMDKCWDAGMLSHNITLYFATYRCMCFWESTYLARCAAMIAPGPYRIEGYRCGGVVDRALEDQVNDGWSQGLTEPNGRHLALDLSMTQSRTKSRSQVA